MNTDVLGLRKTVDMRYYYKARKAHDHRKDDEIERINTYREIMRIYGKELFKILDRTLETRNYYFVRKLGSGSYGVVYLLEVENNQGGVVAQKAVKIIQQDPWDETDRFRGEIDHEIILQKQLSAQTPMFVDLIVPTDVFFQGPAGYQYAFFIMDKIPYNFKSMYSVLKSKNLSNEQISHLVFQIFYILERLRNLELAHYDLHFNNIWVNETNLQDLPHVIDLGEARWLVDVKTDLLIVIQSAFFIKNKHNRDYMLKGLVNLYNQLFPKDTLKNVNYKSIDSKILSEHK